MRNATSILLFGASSLVLTVGACGGGGGGSRDDAKGGTTASMAGTPATGAGTTSTMAGNSSGGASGGSGGAGSCNPVPGTKAGDGKNLVIDDIDDTDTMFTPAGTGAGSWDLSKDTSTGTITPVGTTALKPEAGGQMGSALHVVGTGLTGWGAALAAFLNGPGGSFDASSYGGVAFYIKGTSKVLEGSDKVMVQARMPDVLPGPGSCCSDAMPGDGNECYSGHRVVIGITAEWQEVKIPWAEFKAPAFGKGHTTDFNPNRIRDVDFSFNHDAAMKDDGSSFDFWVDGMRFMSKDEMGNVTPVGSGGSGGSGGGSGGSAGNGAAGAPEGGAQ